MALNQMKKMHHGEKETTFLLVDGRSLYNVERCKVDEWSIPSCIFGPFMKILLGFGVVHQESASRWEDKKNKMPPKRKYTTLGQLAGLQRMNRHARSDDDQLRDDPTTRNPVSLPPSALNELGHAASDIDSDITPFTNQTTLDDPLPITSSVVATGNALDSNSFNISQSVLVNPSTNNENLSGEPDNPTPTSAER